MKAMHGFVAGIVVVLLTAGNLLAQDKPKDLIVGKWQAKEKVGDKEIVATIEFNKDGTMKVTAEGFNFEGKYKLVDDETLETEVTIAGQTKKDTDKIKITKDKITLTDKNGKKTELTRAK